MLGWFDANKKKTFRPIRQHNALTMRLHKQRAATLGTGDLRAAVELPEGEDKLEWIAALTVDFVNDVNLVYGMVCEYCTSSCCPVMCAGPKWEYKWADGKRHKTPIDVSAPQYVDLLFAWVQEQMEDPSIFPTAPGTPFPADFMDHVRSIYRRLYRVFAHIYHCHFERVQSLSFEAHLNTCFKHFMFFVLEFSLINPDELQPLQLLWEKLEEEDRKKWVRGAPATAST